jgi:hypothetical protein
MIAAGHIYGQKSKPIIDQGPETTAIQERRPFDFSAKYYESNGLLSGLMTDRRNGGDGRSVIDFSRDPDHRDVRITETLPAYGPQGEVLYFNIYGEFYKHAFLEDGAGDEAYRAAENYPIYIFPSTTVRYSDRQSALVEIDDSYAGKNPLGLGVAVLVEYTPAIDSKEGREMMEYLAKQNGISLDGTPIIKTSKQIAELTRGGFVRQVFRGDTGGTPYIVGRVILDPSRGAIAPDAYLNFVKDQSGKPLAGEVGFVENFDCLQMAGTFCGKQ